MSTQRPDKQASSAKRYEVTMKDLPLSCPMPDQQLWNAHPKVYLSIDKKTSKASCYYCGALYELKTNK